MRKLFALLAAMSLLAGAAHAALPVPPARTGDAGLDRTLQSIAAEGKSNPSDFWAMVGKLHGIPEADVKAAQQSTGLEPQDIYMSAAVAQLAHRPIGEVAEHCKANPGRGWGEMAKEMGIKPGSPEFHRLKADARNHLTSLKATSKARRDHEKQMEREKGRKAKDEAAGKGHGKSR